MSETRQAAVALAEEIGRELSACGVKDVRWKDMARTISKIEAALSTAHVEGRTEMERERDEARKSEAIALLLADERGKALAQAEAAYADDSERWTAERADLTKQRDKAADEREQAHAAGRVEGLREAADLLEQEADLYERAVTAYDSVADLYRARAEDLRLLSAAPAGVAPAPKEGQ